MPPRAGPRPPPPARPRWPGGCARRPASLWNRQVVVFPGELPFPFGQIRFTHRDDEAPVLSDRAMLEPGHDQVQPLEFHAGNPDGGVHVSLAAPDDHVDAQLVAEEPRSDRSACDDSYDDYDRGDFAPPRHVAIMAPRRQRHRCGSIADRTYVPRSTANSRHWPGMPFSSCAPRSMNSMPDPATRSLTVLETSTSSAPACAATRAPVWTAMPTTLPSAISHSPTGECEMADGKVVGIAVHTGARVAAQADANEVLVSNTVKDLVAGSGIEFIDRGAHELRGIPGQWRLFAVDRGT